MKNVFITIGITLGGILTITFLIFSLSLLRTQKERQGSLSYHLDSLTPAPHSLVKHYVSKRGIISFDYPSSWTVSPFTDLTGALAFDTAAVEDYPRQVFDVAFVNFKDINVLQLVGSDRFETLPPLNPNDIQKSIRRLAHQEVTQTDLYPNPPIDTFTIRGQITAEGPLTLNNLPAYRVRYTRDPDTTGSRLQSQEPFRYVDHVVAAITTNAKHPIAIVLTYQATEGNYSDQVAQALFSSFQERISTSMMRIPDSQLPLQSVAPAATTLLQNRVQYRACRLADILGTLELVDYKTTTAVIRSDHYFYPYQLFTFQPNGYMKHLATTQPIDQLSETIAENAPAQNHYELDPDGTLTIEQQRPFSPEYDLCTAIDADEFRGDERVLSKGDVLLTTFDGNGKIILSRRLRKSYRQSE